MFGDLEQRRRSARPVGEGRYGDESCGDRRADEVRARDGSFAARVGKEPGHPLALTRQARVVFDLHAQVPVRCLRERAVIGNDAVDPACCCASLEGTGDVLMVVDACSTNQDGQQQ